MTTALAKTGAGFTLAPTNWKELLEFAELAAKSDLVPKDYRGKPANIVLAVQWGGELGVAPLQALQGIAVINGRASVWGDLMLALCMQHPDYEDTIETYDEKTQTATCVAKRKGRSDKTHTFSAEDVKRANLGSTHNTYPKRMKQNRARGFALRDQWTDVLKGMISREEAQDYQPEVRAEVVGQPSGEMQPTAAPAGAQQNKVDSQQERKSEPPPASTEPAFSRKFPDKHWAGKPLSAANGEILSDYAAWLESMLQDPKQEKLHALAQKALDDTAAALDAILAGEAAKAADPIADGLQKVVDNKFDDEGSYLEAQP